MDAPRAKRRCRGFVGVTLAEPPPPLMLSMMSFSCSLLPRTAALTRRQTSSLLGKVCNTFWMRCALFQVADM